MGVVKESGLAAAWNQWRGGGLLADGFRYQDFARGDTETNTEETLPEGSV